MLAGIGTGAGEQEAPVGHRGVRRPDLLAVDPPPVTVGDGRRLQRRQIRSRVRLGEPLTPDHRARRDRAEVLTLLRLRPESHDRRPDPVHAHVLGSPWLVVRPHLLAEHRLGPRTGVCAAQFLGPREGEEPLRRQHPAERLRLLEVVGVARERAHERLGKLVGDQLSQSQSERRVIVGIAEIHRSKGPLDRVTRRRTECRASREPRSVARLHALLPLRHRLLYH